jgi:hypothetical protein
VNTVYILNTIGELKSVVPLLNHVSTNVFTDIIVPKIHTEPVKFVLLHVNGVPIHTSVKNVYITT